MDKGIAKKNEKKLEYVKVDSYSVDRATCIGKDDTVFIDVTVNGIKIYGVKVVEGKNGDFLSFPQRQGKDGKWYHIAYCPLSEKDQADIIAAAEAKLKE